MRNFLIILFSAAAIFAESVENSIVPEIEKFERLENHPVQKYSSQQFKQIAEVLNKKSEAVRVVTYNVLFNLYDHNLDEINRWPQRLPRIVELISEMHPDLMGVQELYPKQYEELMPYLEETFAFYSRDCEDGELNGIFYRKDRFELIDSHVWYMTSTPDVPSSETLTMVQLKDLKTGQTFAVFNTHFAFSKVEKRDFQARYIAKKIETFTETMPVILMGDLNTFPNRLDLKNLPFYDGDYIQRILTQGSLRDAKERSILGHLGPMSTFSNAPENGNPFKGTGNPGVFLDHIYVTDAIEVLIHAVQAGTVGGHFPSDHFPLLVDVILKI